MQQALEGEADPLLRSSTSARPTGTVIGSRGDAFDSIECCTQAVLSDQLGGDLLPASSTSAQLFETANPGRSEPLAWSSAAPEGLGVGRNFDQVEGFEDGLRWSLGSPDGAIVGVANPSGVAGKLDIFKSFCPGWFGVCETQATFQIQRQFNAAVRNTGKDFKFSAVHGAPAPFRPGSSVAGSWTGTSQFSSSPLRQVQISWPSDEFSSGRLCVAAGRLQGMPAVIATVYLPPKGPTYPRAKELGEDLLRPLSQELVYGRSGCRAIIGDFNCAPGSLVAHQLWQDCGWIEVQDEMARRHGLTPFNTCKGASRADQIWISPELSRFLTDVGYADLFADHRLLVARFAVPKHEEMQWFWQQPQRLPWHGVNKEDMRVCYEAMPEIERSSDTTSTLRQWARKVETSARTATSCPEDFPNSCLGRCRVKAPRLRQCSLQVPSNPREGHFVIQDSFLGRAVQLWYAQLRRLESLLHNVRRGSNSHEAAAERSIVWQRILTAKGFQKNFARWWRQRPIKLQGAPDCLDSWPPETGTLEVIVNDFKQNYDRFSSWHRDRRQRVIQAKWKEGQDSCFRVARPNPKEQLETLVDTVEQCIEVCDASRQLVRVSYPFPTERILKWTLNQVPAIVRCVDGLYEVESDLVLCDGQVLSCKLIVDEISVIQERLLELWNGRWGRHAGVPESHWQQICDFARRFLPRAALELPPVCYEQWIVCAKAFKLKAATGPDGVSREDILSLPRTAIEELLNIFSDIERGAPWPDQWRRAFVHCVEKFAGAEAVSAYRPITLLSIVYRCWASARTGQLLTHLSQLRAPHQCGFTKDCMPADIWFWIQSGIEAAVASGGSRCGVVADIIKCYNCIPRQPIWPMLHVLGVPTFFTACWSKFLSGLQRSFVVRQSVGPEAESSCGFPEGCPLSCAAMTALDVTWHCYQAHYCPGARALSFVDNLEVVASRPVDAVRGLATMKSFCDKVSLQLDDDKLYGWATTSSDRRSLEAAGVRTVLEARDLGGQVTYCSKHFVHVVVDRIASVKPCFAALRKSGLCLWDRKKCIVGALWPKGLHGCEGVKLGATHFTSLRAGVMRACGWDRPGASPLIRVSLIHGDKLDPFFYQLWRCFWMFCRQCGHNEEIRSAWQALAVVIVLHKAHSRR